MAMKVAGRSCGRMMYQSILKPLAVEPRGLDLLGIDRVEAGEIEDHAIGDLRPEAGGDDAVGDVVRSSARMAISEPVILSMIM